MYIYINIYTHTHTTACSPRSRRTLHRLLPLTLIFGYRPVFPAHSNGPHRRGRHAGVCRLSQSLMYSTACYHTHLLTPYTPVRG